MIAFTMILLFFLIIFFPLRLTVSIVYYPNAKFIVLSARLAGIRAIVERISLELDALRFDGSFTGQVRLSHIKGDNSIMLLKCFSVQSVYVSYCNSIVDLNVQVSIFQRLMSVIICDILCEVSSKRFFVKHSFDNSTKYLYVGMELLFNLAELSFLFVKQGVRQWKTRK